MNKFKILFSTLVFSFGCTNLIAQTYDQDATEVDFYVPGILANDAMQSVNFLLCFIEKTNFQTFIDKGVYKALIDEAQCETADGADATSDQAAATGSSSQSAGAGGAANQINDTEYTAAIFQNVTDGSTISGKGWVDLKLDFNDQLNPTPVTAFVKTIVSEDASETNKFGTFTMYYDLRNQAEIVIGGGVPNIPINSEVERGYLDVDNTTIKYRMSGLDGPPRTLDADLSDPANIQGILQHIVKWEYEVGGVEVKKTYSVKHQVYVNETSGAERYCQKFLEAHEWTQGLSGWSQGNAISETDLGSAITTAKNAGAWIETDGGSDETITLQHCWDLRKSKAKRVIYEYGTYDNSVASNPRISLTTPAMSLEANTTDSANTALQSPIWAHASYWGAHINPADRGNVTDSIQFRNQRDKTDTKIYNLKKNYYEITKKEIINMSLNQLGGVSFQMWVDWQRKDPTWDSKMVNLNFPNVGGTCNAASGDCPEYSGTITVSGSTVTFNVTHGMDWSNNTQPFELNNSFSFTAAEWYSEMTNGSGWNLDMHFWDPDARQSYNVPYAAFNNITGNLVITRKETKIDIDQLQTEISNEDTVDKLNGGAGATGLMCISYCLDAANMNTSLAAAFTALANGTLAATALTTPFKNIGPWFKVDTYYSADNVIDTGEERPAGSYNNIGGSRGFANYSIVEVDGQKIFRDVTGGGANLVYSTANKTSLDQRQWGDGLSKYRYQEKVSTIGSAYNSERFFGWAFTMDTMINSDRMKALAYCEVDSGNARGYSANYKAQAGNAPQHATGATEYFCDEKLRSEVPLTYTIAVKQMPDYRLYNETDSLYVNVSAPETLVLNVDANNVVYNFPDTNLAGKKYKLKFEGFGELHNFPGRVVNTCTGAVLGRYVPAWNPCYRYVHEFTIKDGTVLTNPSESRPDVKIRALRGDEYLEKINPTPSGISYTKQISDLPAASNLQTLFSGANSIGNRPAITLPSAGSSEASVVHGVTVHTPE